MAFDRSRNMANQRSPRDPKSVKIPSGSPIMARCCRYVVNPKVRIHIVPRSEPTPPAISRKSVRQPENAEGPPGLVNGAGDWRPSSEGSYGFDFTKGAFQSDETRSKRARKERFDFNCRGKVRYCSRLCHLRFGDCQRQRLSGGHHQSMPLRCTERFLSHPTQS